MAQCGIIICPKLITINLQQEVRSSLGCAKKYIGLLRAFFINTHQLQSNAWLYLNPHSILTSKLYLNVLKNVRITTNFYNSKNEGSGVTMQILCEKLNYLIAKLSKYAKCLVIPIE